MKADWTRKELDDALDAAQNEASGSPQWQAIKFCRSLLAAQFPNANEIIVKEGQSDGSNSA